MPHQYCLQVFKYYLFHYNKDAQGKSQNKRGTLPLLCLRIYLNEIRSKSRFTSEVWCIFSPNEMSLSAQTGDWYKLLIDNYSHVLDIIKVPRSIVLYEIEKIPLRNTTISCQPFFTDDKLRKRQAIFSAHNPVNEHWTFLLERPNKSFSLGFDHLLHH